MSNIRKRRNQPRLEALEDRCVPSAIPLTGTWTPDRYAPAGFTPNQTDAGRVGVLDEFISASDQTSSRPAPYNSGFYDFQGRASSLPAGTTYLAVDLYVPASWSSLNQQDPSGKPANYGSMASLWATGMDASSNVSSYPIIGFNNRAGSGTGGFQVFDQGKNDWVNVAGFTGANQWYQLGLGIRAGAIDYYVNGQLMYTDITGTGTTTLSNVMLQGYNGGNSYDIYWDNLRDTKATIADAVGVNINATEGGTYTGPVATFTDPDGSAPVGNYTATITWGDHDGSGNALTSQGDIVDLGGGHFQVVGSHTYAEEGSHAVSVVITDHSTYLNGFETASSTNDWTDSATETSAAGISITTSGSGLLPSAPASGTSFAVVQNRNDSYQSGYGSGGYTYFGGAQGTYTGPFQQSVSIYINSAWAAPTDPSSPAFWLDETPYHQDPNNYGAEHNFRFWVDGSGTIKVTADGDSVSNAFATITSSGWYTFQMVYYKAANPSDPALTDLNVFDATNTLVGSKTGLQATSPGGPLASSDLAGHGYAWLTVWQNGFANNQLAIDNLNTSVLPISASAIVNVVDATLSAGQLTPPSATEGVSTGNVVLFHFTDANPNATAADYTAVVTWGDSSSDSSAAASPVVSIVANSSGGFDVVGSHTYAKYGSGLTFSVTVQDKGGATPLTASANFNVTGAPVDVAGTVIFDANQNAAADPGEHGVVGLVVFADTNGNGTLDPGEPSAVTDAQGHYVLHGLTDGQTYTITLAGRSDFALTGPTQFVVTALADQAAPTFTGVPFLNSAPIFIQTQATPSDSNGNRAFVLGLYHDLLSRDGSSDAGVNGWVSLLDSSGWSRTDVAWGVFNSSEQRGMQVQHFYQAFLGRQADTAEQAEWVNYLQPGGTEEQMTALVLSSAEYQAKFTDNGSFVVSLYDKLLGRTASDAEVAEWVSVLNGGTSRADVVQGFVHSKEADLRAVDAVFASFLRREADANEQVGFVEFMQKPNVKASDAMMIVLGSKEYQGRFPA
jgi:hypothetical protein